MAAISSISRLLKLFAMIMVLIPMVWAASCSMVGVGATVAIEKIAESDLAKEAIKSHVKHAVREHNEELNRESRYYEHEDRRNEDSWD
jgi:hypothetical protein